VAGPPSPTSIVRPATVTMLSASPGAVTAAWRMPGDLASPDTHAIGATNIKRMSCEDLPSLDIVSLQHRVRIERGASPSSRCGASPAHRLTNDLAVKDLTAGVRAVYRQATAPESRPSVYRSCRRPNLATP